jgi:hypothetical protein
MLEEPTQTQPKLQRKHLPYPTQWQTSSTPALHDLQE